MSERSDLDGDVDLFAGHAEYSAPHANATLNTNNWIPAHDEA